MLAWNFIINIYIKLLCYPVYNTKNLKIYNMSISIPSYYVKQTFLYLLNYLLLLIKFIYIIKKI